MNFSVHRYTKSELMQQFEMHNKAPRFVSECAGVTSPHESIVPENSAQLTLGEVFHFSKEDRINPTFVERRANVGSQRRSGASSHHAAGRFQHSSRFSPPSHSSRHHNNNNTFHGKYSSRDADQPEWASVSISDLKAHAAKETKIHMNTKYIYVDKTGQIEGPVTLAQLAEWVDLMILSPDTDVKPEDQFEFQKLSIVLNTYAKQQEQSKDASSEQTRDQPSRLLSTGNASAKSQHQDSSRAQPSVKPSTSPSRILGSSSPQPRNPSLLNESPSRILDPSPQMHLKTTPSSGPLMGHALTPPLLTSSGSSEPPLLHLNTALGSSPGITSSRTLSSNTTPSSAPPSTEAHFGQGYSASPNTSQQQQGMDQQHLGPPPHHMQYQQQSMHMPPFYSYPPHFNPQQQHFAQHHVPPGHVPPNAPFGMYPHPQMHPHMSEQQLAFQRQHMMMPPQMQQQYYSGVSQSNVSASDQTSQAPSSAPSSASTPFNVSPFTLDHQQTFNAEDLESQFLTPTSTQPTEGTQRVQQVDSNGTQQQQKVTTPPTPEHKVNISSEDFKSAPTRKKTTPDNSVTTEQLSFGGSKPASSNATSKGKSRSTAPLMAKPPRPQPIVQHAHEIKPQPKPTETTPQNAAPRVLAQSEQDDNDVSLYEPPQHDARVTIAPASNPWAGGNSGSGSMDMKQILQEQRKESKKNKKLEKKRVEAEMAQRAVGAWPSTAPVQTPTSLSFSQIAKQEEEARRRQKKEDQKKAISTGSAADLVRQSVSKSSNAWGSAPSAQKSQQPSLSQILQEEKKKAKKTSKKEQPSGGWSDSLSVSAQAAWGGVQQSSWSAPTASTVTAVTAPTVKKAAEAKKEPQSNSGFWSFDDSKAQQSSSTDQSSSSNSKKKSKKSKKSKQETSWASSVNNGHSASKPADDDFPVLENPFGARVPKTFVQWFKNECKKMGKPELSNDSLLSFLWSVPDVELSSYVENYFGRSNRSFASEFSSQRSFEKGTGVNMAKSKRSRR